MTDQAPPAAPLQPKAKWLLWAFAALGVAAALAVIWLVVMLNSGSRHRDPPVVAAQQPGETFEVGSVQDLPGNSLISIEIRKAGKGYGSGSFKGRDYDLRNVLLLDQTTGESRRLLPDNTVQIWQVSYLPAEAQSGDRDDLVTNASGERRQPKPAYYLIELIREKDGKRTSALLAGSVVGTEQGIVMEGLDGIERRWMIDERRLGLIVREGEALYFRVVDMVDRKVLQSRKIEIG
jgi:hypothetical protein